MSRPDDDGYTLLELLVATILGSFVLVIVSGALSYTGNSRTHLDRVEARSHDVDAARQMISRVLADAQPILDGISYADRTVAFEGSADRIRFVGRLPDAIAEDQTAREELSLSGDGPSKDLWLSWSSALPTAQGDAAQPLYRMKIIDKVRSLHIAFYGADRPAHSPTWRDSWIGYPSLPLLLRVEIDEAGPGKASPILFFIAPRVSATPACRFNPENVSCRRVQ